MGIENRDYYRGASSGTHRPTGFSDMPVVCKRLLIACVVLFVVQMLFTRSLAPGELRAQFRQEGFVPEDFELDEFSPDMLMFHPTVSVAEEWMALDPEKSRMDKSGVLSLTHSCTIGTAFGI